MTKRDRTAEDDAAYERGWVDSLDAIDRSSLQPKDDIYWYRTGWQRCADYRWQDRTKRGVADDRTYRAPRQ